MLNTPDKPATAAGLHIGRRPPPYALNIFDGLTRQTDRKRRADAAPEMQNARDQRSRALP